MPGEATSHAFSFKVRPKATTSPLLPPPSPSSSVTAAAAAAAAPTPLRCCSYIVLVRHGQYVHDSERHLTELGKEQADVTGQRLADLGIKFDKIWYSDVTRATETSRIIEKHLPDAPTEMSQLLRESAPCPPGPTDRIACTCTNRSFATFARPRELIIRFLHRHPVVESIFTPT